MHCQSHNLIMKNQHIMFLCRAITLFCLLTLQTIAMGNNWHGNNINSAPGAINNFSSADAAFAASPSRVSGSQISRSRISSSYSHVSPTFSSSVTYSGSGGGIISDRGLSTRRSRAGLSIGQGGVASMAFQQPIHSGHYSTAGTASSSGSTPPGITTIRRVDDDDDDDGPSGSGTNPLDPKVPVGTPLLLFLFAINYIAYKTFKVQKQQIK